jgi:hypothetical protein
LADHFSKIRNMPSPHFWYMILDGMKYLNEFWSGARAWALYVIFGLDQCHSTVPKLHEPLLHLVFGSHKVTLIPLLFLLTFFNHVRVSEIAYLK